MAGNLFKTVEDEILDLTEFNACNEEFFQCGAVELAKNLIGKYLYFPGSKTAVRIMETEAIPGLTSIHITRFQNRPDRFEVKGGELTAFGNAKKECLYITAGPEDIRDVVLLRSCKPIQGLDVLKQRLQNVHRRTMWNGPNLVVQGVGDEWKSDPLLYLAGGAVQLLEKPRTDESEYIAHGKRTSQSKERTIDSELNYRFALKNRSTVLSYTYKCDDQLSELKEDPE